MTPLAPGRSRASKCSGPSLSGLKNHMSQAQTPRMQPSATRTAGWPATQRSNRLGVHDDLGAMHPEAIPPRRTSRPCASCLKLGQGRSTVGPSTSRRSALIAARHAGASQPPSTRQFRMAAAHAVCAGRAFREYLRSVDTEPWRPLTGHERRLLDAFLAREFRGAASLRIQAGDVLARRGCTCGCGTIELLPQDPEATRATAVNPVEGGRVVDGSGDDIGGLLLFLLEGRLASLEIYSHFDPLPLPEPDQVIWGELAPKD